MKEAVNHRIRAVRLTLNLSQKELSQLLNVKQSYYSEVEAGKRPASAKFMSKLSDNQGVSIDWLVSGKGEMFLFDDKKESSIKLHNSGTNNSLNSDNKLSGNLVEFNVGLEEKVYQLERAVKRYSDDLRKESPELAEIMDNAFILIDFQFFIKHISKEYLDTIFTSPVNNNSYFENGVFNYKRYKEDRMQNLQSIRKLGPALKELSIAIMQFYKEFQPFDNKKILGEHFSELIKG
jgi:transcriptional regulator with XRE-family HTH domain